MNKTKKITRKIIVIVVILLIILMLVGVKSYAAEWAFQIGEEDNNLSIGSFVDGVAGVLAYGLKAIILA